MDRTQFYQIETHDGIDELDHLNNNLTKFAPRYAVSYVRTTASDEARPDMFSYRNYGTVKYWWLLMMYNGVQNPLLDLKAGMLLMVPSILDVYEFYKKYSLR